MGTPGGEVEAVKQIQRTMVAHQPAIRFHAHIRNAISAGIWIVFACDDIWIDATGSVGGAVAYGRNSSTGAAEVDAKMNSILAAEVVAVAQAHGHPSEIVRAMMIMDAELWVSRQGTSAPKLFSTNPGHGATCLDSPASVLTLGAKEAVELGLAKSWPPSAELREKWGAENAFPQASREIDRLFRNKEPIQQADYLASGPTQDHNTILINLGQQKQQSASKMRESRTEIELRKWPRIKKLIESVYEQDPCVTEGSGGTSKQALEQFRARRRTANSLWKDLVVALAYLRKDFPDMPALGQMPPKDLVSLWDMREARLLEVERAEQAKKGEPR